MIAGILLLLVFTPLAFGTVEPWSISILEAGAFGLFALHAGTGGRVLPRRRPALAALSLFLLLIGLVLLQVLPLPDFLLGLISPASLELYRTIGAERPGGFNTVSVAPDATLQELVKLLAYAAVFVVVADRCRSRGRIALLVRTIIFMAVLLVGLAVAQKLTWNGKILWFYPAIKDVRSNLGIWGPYVNRNHFAGYLALTLPLALGLLIYKRPSRGAASKILDYLRSGWIFLLLLVLAVCLLATLSRSGILAAAAAGLFFFSITLRSTTLRQRAVRVAMIAAAFGAVVLVAAFGRLVARFAAAGRGAGLARLDVWRDSLGILGDFPVYGAGLGSYGQIFRRYQTHYTRSFFDHAHNDYLEMAADTGVLGFLVAAGLAAVFFAALLRGWRRKGGRFGKAVGAGGMSSCLAMAVLSTVDFNLRVPANALLFTVVAAISYAAIFNHRDPESGQPIPSAAAESDADPKQRLLVAVGAVVVALLLLTIPVRAFLADRHHRRGTHVIDDGTLDKPEIKPVTAETLPAYLAAAASLERATALAPTRSAYHRALSDVYARLGLWATTMEAVGAPLPAGVAPGKSALARAAAEMSAAIRCEPTNPDFHIALGRIHAAAGDTARAGGEFAKAATALPGNAAIRTAVATAYLDIGDRAAAREQAAALARIDSRNLEHALRIAASAGADDDTLRAMVPRNQDSQAVFKTFMQSRVSERR